MKTFIYSTLAYSIGTMLIAAPWHFVFFKEMYESFGIYNRADPIMPLGFLSMILQGLVMSYLFPRFFKGGSPLGEGLKFGLAMGVFLFSVSTIANAAKIEVHSMSTWFLIQAIFHLIQFASTGLLIGFIHSRNRA